LTSSADASISDPQENEFCNYSKRGFSKFSSLILFGRGEARGYNSLIFDSFTGHTTDNLRGIHRLRNTRDRDLGMFAIMKSESNRVYAHIDFNPQTKNLSKWSLDGTRPQRQ
jgi:hypothetical protein